MDSCFETILNWAQRNYLKLDLRGLITFCSLLFVTPQNTTQTGVSQWRTRKGRSCGWWETVPVLLLLSPVTVIVLSKTIVTQSPIYLFISSSNCIYCPTCTVVVLMNLTESMLCFSGWKWSTKVLGLLNTRCAQYLRHACETKVHSIRQFVWFSCIWMQVIVTGFCGV